MFSCQIVSTMTALLVGCRKLMTDEVERLHIEIWCLIVLTLMFCHTLPKDTGDKTHAAASTCRDLPSCTLGIPNSPTLDLIYCLPMSEQKVN